MEFSVEFTVSELGRSDENGSLLFEAIERVAPGTGPVLAGNFETGTLSTVFEVTAAEAGDALDRGRKIFDAALADAGLPAPRLVGMKVSPAEIAAPAA